MCIRSTLFTAALTLASITSVVSQTSKTLLVDRPTGNDPIRIVKVTSGAAEVKRDERQFPNEYAWETTFDAGDDWLRDISFIIKNVSEKKITYIEISCVVFETPNWQEELTKHSYSANPVLGQASNVVGWRPDHALYSGLRGTKTQPDSRRRSPFELPPGGEFNMTLEDPKNYPTLKSNIEARQPISTATACDATISAIFFEDGTRWSAHKYWRAAQEPGRWTEIAFENWANSTGVAQ